MRKHLSYTNCTTITRKNSRVSIFQEHAYSEKSQFNLIELKKLRDEPIAEDTEILCKVVHKRGGYSVCQIAVSDEALEDLYVAIHMELKRRNNQMQIFVKEIDNE